MRDVLTFAGKSFSDFFTVFDGSKSFASPEKDYDVVSIVGRSGDLSYYNGRFKDIVIPFPCFIRYNFVDNFRNLTEYLNSIEGYQRLETTKEPNHFRKALFIGLVEPQTSPFNHSGQFTIEFRCHPQRWLKSGERTIKFTQNGSLRNPTLQTAKPFIRVYGIGTLTINDTAIEIDSTIQQNLAYTGYVDIDCEIMDAYVGDENMNNYIRVGEFFTLNPGTNTVTLDSVTCDITPRWFEI